MGNASFGASVGCALPGSGHDQTGRATSPDRFPEGCLPDLNHTRIGCKPTPVMESSWAIVGAVSNRTLSGCSLIVRLETAPTKLYLMHRVCTPGTALVPHAQTLYPMHRLCTRWIHSVLHAQHPYPMYRLCSLCRCGFQPHVVGYPSIVRLETAPTNFRQALNRRSLVLGGLSVRPTDGAGCPAPRTARMWPRPGPGVRRGRRRCADRRWPDP